jgi:hypothetical protein
MASRARKSKFDVANESSEYKHFGFHFEQEDGCESGEGNTIATYKKKTYISKKKEKLKNGRYNAVPLISRRLLEARQRFLADFEAHYRVVTAGSVVIAVGTQEVVEKVSRDDVGFPGTFSGFSDVAGWPVFDGPPLFNGLLPVSGSSIFHGTPPVSEPSMFYGPHDSNGPLPVSEPSMFHGPPVFDRPPLSNGPPTPVGNNLSASSCAPTWSQDMFINYGLAGAADLFFHARACKPAQSHT